MTPNTEYIHSTRCWRSERSLARFMNGCFVWRTVSNDVIWGGGNKVKRRVSRWVYLEQSLSGWSLVRLLLWWGLARWGGEKEERGKGHLGQAFGHKVVKLFTPLGRFRQPRRRAARNHENGPHWVNVWIRWISLRHFNGCFFFFFCEELSITFMMVIVRSYLLYQVTCDIFSM